MVFTEYQNLLLAGIAAYEDCLAELPASMKAEMKKATDFKKFNGLACTPTCPGLYTLILHEAKER